MLGWGWGRQAAESPCGKRDQEECGVALSGAGPRRSTPALGPCLPISGLLLVGPGEDDSAPREGREARPAQGAQGRAGSQAGSGTENRLECLSYVPCPTQGTKGSWKPLDWAQSRAGLTEQQDK